MATLLQDLRYALRQLRKSPGFAALAICTLAIGIGASTAIYGIVDGVLLRSLPFHNPQRLISLFESFPAFGFDEITFSAPDYTYVSQHNRSFTGMAAYNDQHEELSGSGNPIRIDTERVNASLFPVLGVSPKLGRVFTQEEDASGAPVVILSNTLWRQHFGSDPNVLGQKILLDRKPYTIIGVMPRLFVFPNHGAVYNNTPGSLYLPMHFSPTQLHDVGNQFNYSVIARLKPGVPLALANADVNGLIRQFSKEYPAGLRSLPHFSVGGIASSYNDYVIHNVRSRLILLQLSVLLVLLIACVDVANLLLARTTGRRREFALRIAVGAPRKRIVSQLLSESLLLALCGGLLSLPLAYGAMHLLTTAAPIDLPRAGSISLSPGVLLFCFGICLSTALLTGLVPALRALRVDPNRDLYGSGRSGMAGRDGHRILAMLVVSQFALAMVLLVTAGLLLRSFQHLVETDPGFQPDHVITMTATLPLAGYATEPKIKTFYRELLDRTTPKHGIRNLGLATSLPMHVREHTIFGIETTPSHAARTVHVAQTWVAGDYIRSLGIRLVHGRFFTPQDREGSQPVAIVSQGFAEKYFPGVDPIGHRIGQVTWMTIVGVVEDVKSDALNKPADPETYTPYFQRIGSFFTDPNVDELRSLYLVARTQQDPNSVRNLLVSTIHSIDPSLPVTDIHTMTTLVHSDIAPQRFNSFILGIFAAIALLLAAAGIGGVLAYTVRQRTQEISVRMALGAQRGDVRNLVLLEGMRLACTGVIIGAVASLLAARWLASQLYRVTTHDPVAFAGGVVILFLIALVACWLPARRAASVDPMQSLRSE